jgi:hypothetical protein
MQPIHMRTHYYDVQLIQTWQTLRTLIPREKYSHLSKEQE